jgi:hypothetical protein
MRRLASRVAAATGLLLGTFAAGGCAAIPLLPSLIGGLGTGSDGKVLQETSVGLNRSNYRLVATNVRGQSRGLTLLIFFTVDPISYAEAFSDLQANAPIEPGDTRAFVNVVHDRSARNFLLFALPKLSVRADVVEFLDAPGKPAAEAAAEAGAQPDSDSEAVADSGAPAPE